MSSHNYSKKSGRDRRHRGKRCSQKGTHGVDGSFEPTGGETSNSGSSHSNSDSIPGFYFDEKKKKYFRISDVPSNPLYSSCKQTFTSSRSSEASVQSSSHSSRTTKYSSASNSWASLVHFPLPHVLDGRRNPADSTLRFGALQDHLVTTSTAHHQTKVKFVPKTISILKQSRVGMDFLCTTGEPVSCQWLTSSPWNTDLGFHHLLRPGTRIADATWFKDSNSVRAADDNDNAVCLLSQPFTFGPASRADVVVFRKCNEEVDSVSHTISVDQEVFSCACDCSSQRFLCCVGMESEVRVYDLNVRKCSDIKRLPSVVGNIFSMTYDKQSSLLYCGSTSGKVLMTDFRTPKEDCVTFIGSGLKGAHTKNFSGGAGFLHQLFTDPSYLLVGGTNGKACLYDVRKPSGPAQTYFNESTIKGWASFSVNRSEHYVAMASFEKGVHICRIGTGHPVKCQAETFVTDLNLSEVDMRVQRSPQVCLYETDHWGLQVIVGVGSTLLTYGPSEIQI